LTIRIDTHATAQSPDDLQGAMAGHMNAPDEAGLLDEIAALAQHVRRLRCDACANSVQIKAAEGQSRVKWDQLRLLRAGSLTAVRPRPDGVHRSPRRQVSDQRAWMPTSWR
jgi:hypothetical protein